MSGKCKPEEYRVAILVEYKIIFYAEAQSVTKRNAAYCEKTVNNLEDRIINKYRGITICKFKMQ